MSFVVLPHGSFPEGGRSRFSSLHGELSNLGLGWGGFLVCLLGQVFGLRLPTMTRERRKRGCGVVHQTNGFNAVAVVAL